MAGDKVTKKAKYNRRIKPAESQASGVLQKMGAWLITGLILLAVALVLAFSVYYGSQSVRQIMQRPIAQVMVKSDFNFVGHDELSELIKDTINQSFLHEDLNGVRESLLDNPWIEDASVSRQWPDKLVVTVKEEHPIARWKDVGFVNYKGQVVVVDDKNRLSHLPELAGPQKDSIEVMQQYHVLSKLLRPYGFEIAAINKGARNDWRLWLSNGWEIVLGRGQAVEKVQRFIRVLDDQLKQHQDRIAAIDVRYNHGVSVRWRADTNNNVLTKTKAPKQQPSS